MNEYYFKLIYDFLCIHERLNELYDKIEKKLFKFSILRDVTIIIVCILLRDF